MSQLLGSKFDHFAESQMAHLINLIPNSAKIMATSGIVCIRFDEFDKTEAPVR
jgi:CLIP-associating protein 1/2